VVRKRLPRHRDNVARGGASMFFMVSPFFFAMSRDDIYEQTLSGTSRLLTDSTHRGKS